MPAPEPDLDAVVALLDPASWAGARRPRPGWLADRDAAVAALCWLVGLRPFQLRATLRRRDWRPRNRERVEVRVGGRYAATRTRELPVLDAARDAVGRYLRSCPFDLSPDGPLLRHADGTDYRHVDVLHADRRLRRMGGPVEGLADLAGRYRRYVEWTRASDGTVERLAGRAGPFDRLDPGPKALLRALRAAHPLGRESRAPPFD